MKFCFPCDSIEFFAAVPNIYSRQKERKLSLIKRQGLQACLGTCFLREANSAEAPANYVLQLQEPDEEPVLILLRWFLMDGEEAVFFLRIVPDRYNSSAVSTGSKAALNSPVLPFQLEPTLLGFKLAIKQKSPCPKTQHLYKKYSAQL